MSELQRPQLQPIYDRLHSAPRYHPLDANTFSDWSMEAGDMITVTRDGQSYQSPVHTSKMTWRKGQQISVSSTGNEKRESIAKMSQNKFNESNSSSLRNATYQRSYASGVNRRMLSGLELNDSYARLYVKDAYDRMQAGLELTSSTAHLYVEDKYNQMTSGLALTASTAALYVEDKYNQMVSGLSLTRSSWALSVAGVVDAYGKVTAASIVGKINTTGSEIYINADHIKMNGVVMSNAITIADNYLTAYKPIIATNGLYYQHATSTDVPANTDMGNAFVDVVDPGYTNNSKDITFYKANGGTKTVTFSRATTLTAGAWSGSKFNVQASPQGNTYSVGFVEGADMRLDIGGNASGTPPLHTGSDYYIDYPIKVYQVTGNANPPTVHTTTLTVDGTAAYNKGKDKIGISDLEWEHDGDYFSLNHNSTNTIKNHTTNKSTNIPKEASINMTQDANWASNGKKWVYVRQGTSSSGQYVCGLEVTAPAQKVLASTTDVQPFTTNGIKFPPAGYDGWSEIEIQVDAGNLYSGVFTANTNGWAYPPSGYGGFDAVKVEVPTPTVSVSVDAVYGGNSIGTVVGIRGLKNGTPETTRYLYLETSGSYVYATLDAWKDTGNGTDVGRCSRTGSISMPSNQISTTSSWLSGSYDPPSQLVSAINRARADGDWCYFRVDCTCGASKRYQFQP